MSARAWTTSAASVLVTAVLVATAHPARADDKRVCLTSYVEAQKDRQAAHLRAAAIELTRCGASVCPGAVRDDCVRWYAEVQAATPSLVVSFTDADGKERGDVRVSIDGEKRAASLDGRGLPVDPGTHRVELSTAGGDSVSTTVLVREGEHDRRVDVRAPPRASAAMSRPVPPLAWALGGVGAAGIVTWASFGLVALYAHPGLASTLSSCKPSCPSSDVSTVRTRFAVADVAAGIGVLSLAGAAYVFFTRPTVSASAAPKPDVSLGFGPNGVNAGFRVTF
jgi:hypothetical protein